MNRLHIVGRKGHGKTVLILELIEGLRGLGYRVGTIKHTRHLHDLDTPGKDSHRHRLAGSTPSAIVTGGLIGVYLPNNPKANAYETLAPLFEGCDLVLVEGDLEAVGHKIEVWRQSLGTPCLGSQRSDINAVITDDDPHLINTPILARSNRKSILTHIESQISRFQQVRS